MSSTTVNNVDEKRPFTDADTPVSQSAPNSRSQVPTPPQSHHEGDNNVDEDEYSDALSADSQQQRQKRRHPRGGRKQKQLRPSAQHLQSVSEIELPTARRQAQPEEEEEDYFDEEHDEEPPLLAPPLVQEAKNQEDEYDADALKKARGSRSKAQPRRPKARNRSTGISSFSIERPRGGGRKPPVAVSVERPGEKSKVKSKSKKSKKEAERETEDGTGEGSLEDESEDEREEEEPRKPVQIRLDLNLEIEILMKAKIKGDITITFLE